MFVKLELQSTVDKSSSNYPEQGTDMKKDPDRDSKDIVKKDMGQEKAHGFAEQGRSHHSELDDFSKTHKEKSDGEKSTRSNDRDERRVDSERKPNGRSEFLEEDTRGSLETCASHRDKPTSLPQDTPSFGEGSSAAKDVPDGFMGSPERVRSVRSSKKRDFEEDIEVNTEIVRDDNECIGDSNKKQRLSKSNQLGSGDDVDGLDSSGKRRSTPDVLSSWHQDGDVENKLGIGDKPGSGEHHKAEESGGKKSSSNYPEQGTDMKKDPDRDSKDIVKKDMGREKADGFAEQGRSHHRRWGELDDFSKTHEEKSDGEKSTRSNDRDERSVDSERKPKGRSEFLEEDTRGSLETCAPHRDKPTSLPQGNDGITEVGDEVMPASHDPSIPAYWKGYIYRGSIFYQNLVTGILVWDKPALDDSSIPAPWKGFIREGRIYYWNSETGIWTWDKPILDDPSIPAPWKRFIHEGRIYFWNSVTGIWTWDKPILDDPSIPAHWKRFIREGRIYYWNSVTGNSVWVKPTSVPRVSTILKYPMEVALRWGRRGFLAHGGWPTVEEAMVKIDYNHDLITGDLERELKNIWPNEYEVDADDKFWENEWIYHGRFSGLDQVTYFQCIVEALRGFDLPSDFGLEKDRRIRVEDAIETIRHAVFVKVAILADKETQSVKDIKLLMNTDKHFVDNYHSSRVNHGLKSVIFHSRPPRH